MSQVQGSRGLRSKTHSVNDWKGTPVEDAIHELATRGVPIGGTSAGTAILSVRVDRAAPGSTFNLRGWTGTGLVSYMLNVANGALSSTGGSIY